MDIGLGRFDAAPHEGERVLPIKQAAADPDSGRQVGQAQVTGGVARADLSGRRFLVVEDDFLIAQEIRDGLTEAGAQVVGPVPSVAEALHAIDTEAKLDGAILDVNLGGERGFPVADALRARNTPFVFMTGYDQALMPETYADVPRCEKPAPLRNVVRALGLN